MPAGDELVTRVHLEAIEGLRTELAAVDWKVCGTAVRVRVVAAVAMVVVVVVLGPPCLLFVVLP